MANIYIVEYFVRTGMGDLYLWRVASATGYQTNPMYTAERVYAPCYSSAQVHLFIQFLKRQKTYPIATAIAVNWIVPWNTDRYVMIHGAFFNTSWQNDFQNHLWWGFAWLKDMLYVRQASSSAQKFFTKT